MLMIAVAGCLTIGGCSSDDDNNSNTPIPNADLVGTYKMTAWNVPEEVDLDDDGVVNTNLLNETECYDESMMTINSNGTYTMMYSYVNIEGGAMSCQNETTTGTWVRNGNSFTTTHISGGQNMNTPYTFASGNTTTLTRNITDGSYPTVNNGTAEYAQGNISIVMTRQ